MQEKKQDKPKLESQLNSIESENNKPEIKDKEAQPETPNQNQETKKLDLEIDKPSFELTKIIKKKKTIIPTTKDEMTIKIEQILEDGLNDSYQQLSPIARQEFKLKGEQIAIQIRQLMKKTHMKIRKILKLILGWLKMLPGLNHFFLEQEAKIKAEKILRLK